MRALIYEADRSRPYLHLGEVPDPKVGPGEVLLEVSATALNRADLLQVRGLYPPPPGESGIPGLECAGTVAALGEGVTEWRPGDRVMALLAGGGHAERVVVPGGQLLALPTGLDFVAGAAIPEVALTAWTNLVEEAALQAGESLLITAAASGVGCMAVQVARELGSRVLVAGRNAERLEALRPLGASAILPLGEALPREVRKWAPEGVDVVLDLVGGEGIRYHLGSLAEGGRLVLVGLLGGASAHFNLGEILSRRLRLVGSVLRGRSRGEKARLVSRCREFLLPRLEDERLRPVIDRVVDFAELPEAYVALEDGGVLGKIVVRVAQA